MKKLLKRFEAMAMAVAFAEAGEWETAKQIMEKKSEITRKKNDRQNKTKADQRSKRPVMRV